MPDSTAPQDPTLSPLSPPQDDSSSATPSSFSSTPSTPPVVDTTSLPSSPPDLSPAIPPAPQSQSPSSLFSPISPPASETPSFTTEPPISPPLPDSSTPPISPPPPIEPPLAPEPIAAPDIIPAMDSDTQAILPPAAEDNGSEHSSRVQGSIFKYLIPAVVVILGLFLLYFLYSRFFAPQTSKTKTPEPITLNYWGLWEDNPVIKAVLSEYQTQNPNVTINYQQQSHKDYRERLQSALARGEGPDIFRFHNTWVPMLKNELASIPASVFDSTSFSATFYPVAQKDLTLSGNILGVPLMIDGLGLYYNKKIFTSGGKTPPTSWEELRQSAFDLTVRDAEGKITTAGIALGITSNIEHWSDILALMMLQNSADPANPIGEPAESALKFYTIFSISDRVWDATLPNSVYAFATEKVAMIFAPSWQAHTLKQINPNLDFGIVPVPQLPTTNVTWASYWVEGVSKKSAQTEEAFKVLKFLSEKDKLVKFYTEATKVRQFGEPYPRKDMADLLKTDPLVYPFISEAPNAKSFYMASRTFDNGINDKIIKYYEDAINATNQGQDVKEVLQTAAQGIQQVLSQYGISSSTPAK